MSIRLLSLTLVALLFAFGTVTVQTSSVHAGGTFVQDEEPPSAEDLMNEARELFQDGDIDGAIEKIEQAHKAEPDNINVAGALISVLQSQGMRASEEERVNGNKYFYKAGKVAAKLLDGDEEMPEGLRRLLATAIYNEACSYSVDKKYEEAIKSLDRALTEGFSDYAQIDRDEDFTGLRDKAEFKELIAKHKKMYAERVVEEVKKEMEAHEAYDFEFALTSVDGKEISKESYAGKVLIVDIWGTWCPPCREEIPHFIKLQEEYGKQGLEIVGLNYENGDDEEEITSMIKEFMEEHDMNYTCAIGDEETREQVPNFRGFPTTLFIDTKGNVRLTLVGLQPHEKLEAVVKILLEEAK